MLGYLRRCSIGAVLLGVSLGSIGCASSARMNSAERRLDAVEYRAEDNKQRIETLDQRVFEISRDCCGKSEKDCKCQKGCVPATVQGGDGNWDGSADCEIVYTGRTATHYFEDSLEVTVRRELSGRHYFIDPETGQKCYLGEGGSWNEGEKIFVTIGTEMRVRNIVTIRGASS